MIRLINTKYCQTLSKAFSFRFATVKEDLSNERVSYEKGTLDEYSLDKDPFVAFANWYHEAKNTKEIREANAMVLSTASKNGIPSARPVLLKAFDDDGFVFYTNYRSRKAQDIGENPNASLVFYWDTLEKVIRIEGLIQKISEQQSTEYFNSRPRESQIGAWASHFQSAKVSGREELEKNAQEYEEKFKGIEVIPKPDYWGGFIVQPLYFEFWQGRQSRLHDRICFERKSLDSSDWKLSRLSP